MYCNVDPFSLPLAAAVEHIPPKNQHTVRYYGLYSNKRRGMDARARRPSPKLCCAAASARKVKILSRTRSVRKLESSVFHAASR
jgi:hypothetical protein